MNCKTLYSLWKDKNTKSAIMTCCVKKQIKLTFSSPQAPHFGALGGRSLNYEISALKCYVYCNIYSSLVDVEATSNSWSILPLDCTDSDSPRLLLATFLFQYYSFQLNQILDQWQPDTLESGSKTSCRLIVLLVV